MIQSYLIVAGRIRQEVSNLETTVNRAERAIAAVRQEVSDNQDLFIDAAALSLHDFYTGLERILSLVATTVDKSMPSTQNWVPVTRLETGVFLFCQKPGFFEKPGFLDIA